MKLFKLLFLIAIICLSCENERVDSTLPERLEYNQLTDVSYGPDANQTYDLYLPEGRTLNTRVMILVHGGGWTSGDKSSMDYLINLFRTDFPDMALVNINYRLADENNPPYPMQIDDITSIVNQLKSNKNEYIISENYGFLGISAGGHLSLLWSYGFDAQQNVNMVCSIVGPTNFTDPAYLNNSDPLLQALLLEYNVDQSIAFLEEVSPLHRATTSSPPTILFYGGQDPLIPTTQGTGLRDRLNELNVTNEFTLYPEAGHGWGDNPGELSLLIDTWNRLKSFTQNYLYN
ncbi:alpha/beta hydrolase [Aestuariivivens sediminicola]|uniref:alpha/beta hydrolase n=1 Tax=Aestuariivivens sediminicola TaxID=2913560 RepID=UPI001F568AEF|nr:alpha/beta hydrolase [Aestuariivivens sediminicola]